MITDEQVNAFINAFELNGGHFLGNNEFDTVRKALEAYEQSKWVKFDVDDESTYPKRIIVLARAFDISTDKYVIDIFHFMDSEKHKIFSRLDRNFYAEMAVITDVCWQYLPEFKE